MSQPLLVSCPGCDTTYDVSRRAPGKRLRCPRCGETVVVPERAPDAAPPPPPPPPLTGPVVTGSSRLRRARGPACTRHPRRTADGRCAGCGAHCCETCWAPAPVDHLCARCAEGRGLEGALPVDFGLLATPAVAMRALGASVGRLVLWTLFSIAATFTIFSIPLVLLVALFTLTDRQSMVSQLLAAGVFACAVAMLATHFLFLVPSGSAVFLDHALRGRRPPLRDAFREAWWRFVGNAPRLFGVFVVVALLYLPYLFLVLGAAWFINEASSPLALLFLVLALPLGFYPILTALGLAVPVVILEERTAHESLARAWELVRGHLLTFGALVFFYFLLVAVLGLILGLIGSATGLDAVFGMISQMIDVLLWPSLLVAAYHGLAAEHAGVLGRR